MHNSSFRSQNAFSFGLLQRIFLILLFCVSSTQVLAARIELAPNDWKQLVIPANPAGATVGDLFLDDFESVFPDQADYGFGTGWAVFLFNQETQSYDSLSLESVPQTGHAFWIIQSSSAPVMLDVPDTLPAAIAGLASNCVSEQGCFTLDLPDSTLPETTKGPLGQRYAMIGSPYPFYTVLSDLRLLTNLSNDPCTDGCNLTEAEDLSYSVDNLWVWNSSVGSYDNVSTDATSELDVLPAWQGYWLVVREEVEEKRPQLRIPYDPQIATVNGRITTASGDVVAGAQITAEGVGLGGEVSSDSDGSFVLTLVADAEYTVTIETDSHARQVKLVKAPPVGGSVDLPITLIETDVSYTFNANAGGVFTGSDGVSVEVEGGSFVMADGSTITGSIDLEITSVDISNPALLDAFPGEFSGVGSNAEQAAIYSLGTSNYSFSVRGEPVQLNAAIGATAQIMIPIYTDTYQTGASIMQGDRIPLWSLNELTGIWEQEGEGVVSGHLDSPTGLVLSASVSHFTWWNCDVTMDAVPVIIGIEGPKAGTALITATASGDLGWRPNTVDTVVAVGSNTPSLFVPGDREVCYTASLSYDDGTTGSTSIYCASPPVGTIVLSTGSGDSPLQMVTDLKPDSGGAYAVTGYPGIPLRRVGLSAVSIESTVSYLVLNGSLPEGITLKKVGDTRAEISGIPEQGSGGSYPITVQARNTDGETFQIDMTIEIPLINPPPVLPATLNAVVNGNFEQDSYSFMDDNTGGPATSWSLTPALPEGAVFDSESGEITLLGVFESAPGYWDWQGTVTASNASGSSSSAVTLSVDCDWCGPFD